MALDPNHRCSERDLLPHAGRAFVFNAQKSTDSFLMILFHLEKEQSRTPFKITSKGKRRTHRMHYFSQKRSLVTFRNHLFVDLFISGVEQLFQLRITNLKI